MPSNNSNEVTQNVGETNEQNELNRRTIILEQLDKIPLFTGTDPYCPLDKFKKQFNKLAEWLRWTEGEKIFLLEQRLADKAQKIIERRESQYTTAEDLFKILEDKLGKKANHSELLKQFWAFKQTNDMPVEDFVSIARAKAAEITKAQNLQGVQADQAMEGYLLDMLMDNIHEKYRHAVLSKRPKTSKEFEEYALNEEFAFNKIKNNKIEENFAIAPDINKEMISTLQKMSEQIQNLSLKVNSIEENDNSYREEQRGGYPYRNKSRDRYSFRRESSDRNSNRNESPDRENYRSISRERQFNPKQQYRDERGNRTTEYRENRRFYQEDNGNQNYRANSRDRRQHYDSRIMQSGDSTRNYNEDSDIMCFRCNRMGHKMVNCKVKINNQENYRGRNHSRQNYNRGRNGNKYNVRNSLNQVEAFQGGDMKVRKNEVETTTKAVENFNTFEVENCKLPIIEIEINRQNFKTLCDSGSTASLLSSSVIQNCEELIIEPCAVQLNTISNQSFDVLGTINLKFRIDEENFKEKFYVINSTLSPHFDIILGTPFFHNYDFSLNFNNNTISNKNICKPLSNFEQRNNQILVNHISNINIPIFNKSKQTIPPLSEKIVQVKINKNLDFISDFAFIVPPQNSIGNHIFVGASVCNLSSDDLFVKIINLHDEEVHLNKNTKLGHVQPIFQQQCRSEEFVGHIKTNEIAPLDNLDLQWSPEFKLDHLEQNLRKRVENFLKENSDVFANSVLDLKGCSTIMHEVKLKDDTPVKSKPYRVPYHLRKELEEQLNLLLEGEIIEPSTSEFATPIILIRKKDNSLRLACDFRKLNKQMVRDTYPLPNISDTIDELAGHNYFTTLDLMAGFYQQMLKPEHKQYTTITTHMGTFQFLRSPFGLCNSGNSFQRLMNVVLGDLRNIGILVYIDDICISSRDIDTHFERLSLVFERLRAHNLKLKPSKCNFFQKEIEFLGFKVTQGKIMPTDKNINVISKLQTPKTRKQVRAVLGVTGFYRKFCPDYSKRTINLTNLTKEKTKFIWSEAAQKEFEDLKNFLTTIPSLNLPDMNREFVLFTDASGVALGCVIAQYNENNFPCPVAFASRKLNAAEQNYPTTERELLAIVWAVSYFKCYLLNKKFTIFTDHAALTYALKIKDATSRINRWLMALSEFDYTIKYIKGKCNSVADFLSRWINHDIISEEEKVKIYKPQLKAVKINEKNEVKTFDKYAPITEISNNKIEVNSENKAPLVGILKHTKRNKNVNTKFINSVQHSPTSTIEINNDNLINKIKIAQKQDKYASNIISRLEKNLQIQPRSIKFFMEEGILKCNILNAKTRRDRQTKIVLPLALVPEIFSLAHDSLVGGHNGFFKTKNRIMAQYYWKGSYVNIKELVESCEKCMELKAHRKKGLADLQRMPIPNVPLETVHCDISGPYPVTENGNRYILVFIDAFSKWPEAYPLRSMESDTIADKLADFICRHGCPKTFITDRGTNFMSRAIEKVYKMLEIEHIATSAFHPSSNSKCERVHGSISNILSQFVGENHLSWDVNLKFALLAIRSAVHVTVNETPHYILTGRDMRLPYSILEQKPNFSYADAPSYCETLVPALQNVYQQVRDKLEKVADKQEEYRHRTAVDKKITVGSLVMLYTPVVKPNQCKKFTKMNSGPYRVIRQLSRVNFEIQEVANPSNIKRAHVDRLNKISERPTFPKFIPEQELEEERQPEETLDERNSPPQKYRDIQKCKGYSKSVKNMLLYNQKPCTSAVSNPAMSNNEDENIASTSNLPCHPTNQTATHRYNTRFKGQRRQ